LSLIHNERTKLTANWLDRAGTAAVAIGVIAPIAAAVFGYGNPPFSTGRLAIGVAFWFFTRNRTTSHCEAPLEEATAMNSVEFLAFVGAPLMLLATGVGVYFLTGWLDRREHRRTPAE